MTVKAKVNTSLANYGNPSSMLALAKDSLNVLWAVYRSSTGTSILAAYSSNGGATWTEETITSGTNNVWDGVICIDSNNLPHACYVEWFGAPTNKYRVYYRNRTGGVWGAVEQTYEAVAYPRNICLVIGSNNIIHILVSYSDAELRYIYGTSGAWNDEQVAASAWTRDGALAIDSSNVPRVIYSGQSGIAYIDRSGGSWGTHEVLPVQTGWDAFPELVIDSADDVHVVWKAIGDGDIMYNKRTSGSWGSQIIVADKSENPDDEYYTSSPIIVIDSSDAIYVIYQYQDGTTYEETIWYKKKSGVSFGVEITLDSDLLQPASSYTSLYGGLYHKNPTTGIPTASLSPIVLLLNENGAGADIYYEAPFFALPSSQAIIIS